MSLLQRRQPRAVRRKCATAGDGADFCLRPDPLGAREELQIFAVPLQTSLVELSVARATNLSVPLLSLT
jgi:hypothetical protein